ncbi:MAG: L-threonylcarbamoyladenylate synthase [Candidatus Woesearchaeota archaeon]
MQVIKKNNFWSNGYLDRIKKGALFIYPTDTIYGLGCDATLFSAVKKARKVKGTNHPFSVVAPSKKWIRENCVVLKAHEKWISKLPGKYTLLLNMKNKNCVAKNVSFADTLGVRIPSCWTKNIARRLGRPIISTSANLSGQKPIKKPEETNITVDFFIDGGTLSGKASRIIDLTGKKAKMIRR